MTKATRQILGGIKMAANPDVDGGLVSDQAVPLDDARRIVSELTEQVPGIQADWAPAGSESTRSDAMAWLYVTEAP